MAALFACGEAAGPRVVSVQDLAGTWKVTKLEWTDPTATHASFDFILNAGSLTVTIEPNGTVGGNGSSPLTGSFTLSGSIAVQGTTLAVGLTASTGGTGGPSITFPDQFAFALVGNVLTLTSDDAQFDFGFDQTVDPAHLQIVLQRQ